MLRNGAFKLTDKKSFVLYHDIREPLEQLTMEQRGELFTAILDYSEHGTLPLFTGELRMAFAFIRSAIDRDAVAWEQKRKKRAEAGRLGGLAKVANATYAKQNGQTVANQAVNVPVPVNVPVNTMANATGTNGEAPARPIEGPSVLPELCTISPETKPAPWTGRKT